MSKKKTNTEEEVLVQVDVISQELEKHNVTETALREMEDQYMQLTIKGIDDKEGLKQVYEARIRCKNTRVLTSKICKADREEALARQRSSLSKEKEIVSRISVVEDYLKSEEDKIENEKARIKAESEKVEQERIQYRTMMLFKHGVAFNGEVYSIGEVRITPLQVKLFDDFTFEGVFSQVVAEFQLEQVKKEEEAAVKLIEEERIKKVAEEQRIQSESLKKREEELLAKEAAIKADAEAKVFAMEAERKKIAEEKALADNAKIKQRASQLFTLGIAFNGDTYKFGGLLVMIPQTTLLRLDQEEWDKLLAETTVVVSEEKARIAKELATKQELERKEDAEKVRKETEDQIKKEEEAKLKALQEEEAKIQREDSLKPDKEKLEKLATEITNYILPDLTSDAGKVAMAEITLQFSKFGMYLTNKANQLT